MSFFYNEDFENIEQSSLVVSTRIAATLSLSFLY